VVQEYINDAALPQDLGNIRAIIVPHAGYVYSGPVAGYAFKALQAQVGAAPSQQEWTIFLLGPAHRAYFHGVALGNYSAFRTPLGDVPVAVERVADMIARSSFYIHAPEAHEYEHCLEVELPFLQSTVPSFRLVPMLFGEVDPLEVAADLADHVGANDLIVVSNDLSHFYPYDRARQLDLSLLEALLAGDEAGVLAGEACGRAPVATLMGVARRKGWSPHLLDYRNSGDTAGEKWQVVGYASVAYTD